MSALMSPEEVNVESVAEGWYPDPYNQAIERHWDGNQWTPATRPIAAPALYQVPPTITSATVSVPVRQAVAVRSPSGVVSGWTVIVGGALLAIGTTLSWVNATTGLLNFSRSGFQLGPGNSLTPDGPVVLGLGIVLMIITATRLTSSTMPRFLQRSPIVVALGAAAVLGDDYRSVHNWVLSTSNSTTAASIGIGYWMCCVGATLALLAGISLLSLPPKNQLAVLA